MKYFKKIFKKVKSHIHFFLFYYRIKNITEFSSCNDIISFALPACLQKEEEIKEFARYIIDKQPSVVVEIGTARGGTLFILTRCARSDATIVSIDLPGGPFGGGYSLFKIPLYKSFALNNQKVHLLRENSHSNNTREKLRQILNNKRIDILFIDGDHTYEGVKTDFELYSPLMSDKGSIALHDIVRHDGNSKCDVYRFWDEIKEKYDTIEIIDKKGLKWGGIGLIKLNSK